MGSSVSFYPKLKLSRIEKFMTAKILQIHVLSASTMTVLFKCNLYLKSLQDSCACIEVVLTHGKNI